MSAVAAAVSASDLDNLCWPAGYSDNHPRHGSSAPQARTSIAREVPRGSALSVGMFRSNWVYSPRRQANLSIGLRKCVVGMPAREVVNSSDGASCYYVQTGGSCP